MGRMHNHIYVSLVEGFYDSGGQKEHSFDARLFSPGKKATRTYAEIESEQKMTHTATDPRRRVVCAAFFAHRLKSDM